MTASESDYLPLVMTMGYRQSTFVDWTNKFGRGHRAIYKSSPNRQYYQYLAPNFEFWVENHLYNLKNNFYTIKSGHDNIKDGKSIRTLINLKNYEKTKIQNL